MKKNLFTFAFAVIMLISFAASGTEKPRWVSKKIPAGFEEVESRHTMKIVTLSNRYDCSVFLYKDGEIEIFTDDDYYRRNSVMEHFFIREGAIDSYSVMAFRDKGKVIKYGPTYPVFKEKFLKEIHGLPWKIQKEILNAFPPPQKK